MLRAPENVLYYGVDQPPQRPIKLRAGPLSLLYDNGVLRNIALGDTPVIHQIYSAVRDPNWDTIPGQMQDVLLDRQARSFAVSFRSEHVKPPIDFDWTGTIFGSEDGTITYHMRGKARSTFQRNRIGFCVLHPMSAAGLPLKIEHVNGSIEEGRFPVEISPHQPYYNIRAIHHEAAPGVWAEVRMEGDTFEMEDQRNWTDASFKTYCTPHDLPSPVTVEAGTVIEQRVVLKVEGVTEAAPSREPLTVTISDGSAQLLPGIGLCAAEHGEPLSVKAIQRLRALHLTHLRVDLYLNDPLWSAAVQRAADEAHAMGCALDIAAHVTDEAEAELIALRQLIDKLGPNIGRWLIFHQNEDVTAERWVEIARRVLGSMCPVGAGTNGFFTQLNRERPSVELLDAVCYSVNPQVHATDNASMVETLAVLPMTVAMARSFSGNKPVIVGPVTLKIRRNPEAAGTVQDTAPDQLPPRVDVRQMSLFGAAWTLGSLKAFSVSDAAAVTYYETSGWLGVMERENGSPLPDKFMSIPGGVFPVYHVFADVAEMHGGRSLPSVSSNPLTVEALALTNEGRLRVMLANYSPDPQPVTVRGLPNGLLTLRSLDANNAESAMRDPESFRATTARFHRIADNTFALSLSPYGLATLETHAFE